MSSCSPDYDEHFAALAAGYGPAAWADPREPDGTARRARQRRADSKAQPSATRAFRRLGAGRARRAALAALAIVSLMASAGLAAQLLDRAEPAPEATFDAPRAGTGTAHLSTGVPTRSRTVRSSANRVRRPSTSKKRKSARRHRVRPRRASTERTATRRGRVLARPSPPGRSPQPPVAERPLTAPTRPTRPSRPATPARDSACIEFPPC